MKTIVKEIKVFNFSELNEKGKEKAIEDYLSSGIRNDDFQDILDDTIGSDFKNSELNYQYSLSNCQGDGFNLYGSLNLKDILNFDLYDIDVKKNFNEKEIYILNWIFDNVISYVELEYNNWYSYCVNDANAYSIIETIRNEYENYFDTLKGFNEGLIEKFALLVDGVISRYCEAMEEIGYDYLWNVSEEEFNELSEANDWNYLEDGTFYRE